MDRFAPHLALKFIAGGKLTFDEMSRGLRGPAGFGPKRSRSSPPGSRVGKDLVAKGFRFKSFKVKSTVGLKWSRPLHGGLRKMRCLGYPGVT